MKPSLKILNIYSRAPPAVKLTTPTTTTMTTPALSVTASLTPLDSTNSSQSTLLTKLLPSTVASDLALSTTELKPDSNEFLASFKSSPTAWPTPPVHSEEPHAPHYEYDDTLDILMPLFVGLLVAIILGWMLMRYKMSAHQRSNYNGSIYCCPEECFNFCSRFLECQFR